MPLFDEKNPLTPEQVEHYEPALERTQGNILKSHGRHHTINAFLTFHGPIPKVKDALRGLADQVTWAWQQSQQRPEHHVPFVGFGLSALGYAKLEVSLAGFSPEFKNGMTLPRDPAPSQWDEGYRRELHAMLLVAHGDDGAVEKPYGDLIAPFRPLADIHEEPGIVKVENGGPVEHFRFRDGISQPLFFKEDVDKVATDGGIDQWNPGAGPDLVLVKDPRGQSESDCGSYFVFRKLEQDVAGFMQREGEFLDALRVSDPLADPELAGAMLVGRFRDGTPVVLDRVRRGGVPLNNFRFQPTTKPTDGSGKNCPFSAHIRKVNPRGDSGDANELGHRIARRGITYESPAGKGLLFQCCQADLKKQFEFMQARWCDQAGPPSELSGFDPVAGQATGANQRWCSPWGHGTLLSPPFDFGGFVKLKGGAYFFLPSRTFLQSL